MTKETTSKLTELKEFCKAETPRVPSDKKITSYTIHHKDGTTILLFLFAIWCSETLNNKKKTEDFWQGQILFQTTYHSVCVHLIYFHSYLTTLTTLNVCGYTFFIK